MAGDRPHLRRQQACTRLPALVRTWKRRLYGGQGAWAFRLSAPLRIGAARAHGGPTGAWYDPRCRVPLGATLPDAARSLGAAFLMCRFAEDCPRHGDQAGGAYHAGGTARHHEDQRRNRPWGRGAQPSSRTISPLTFAAITPISSAEACPRQKRPGGCSTTTDRTLIPMLARLLAGPGCHAVEAGPPGGDSQSPGTRGHR